MMNLCVFQGTFNPIHNAHIRVVDYVARKYNFEKILFIPAYNPPHKICDNNEAVHRLNMVKLAVESLDNIEVSDIEFQRKGVSYTYLTICELIKKYKIKNKISFIIGTDAFEKIESWYKIQELKKLVHFIVFAREQSFNPKKIEYLRKNGYDFEVETLDFEDISSTQIREKIKNNENIEKYVDKKVEEYIRKYGLYRN